MKAVLHDRYGPPRVLRVAEVERPLPADDEVLVKVRATTVTRTDCHVRRASPFLWRLFTGLLRPRRKILGIEYAGVTGSRPSARTSTGSRSGTRSSAAARRQSAPVDGDDLDRLLDEVIDYQLEDFRSPRRRCSSAEDLLFLKQLMEAVRRVSREETNRLLDALQKAKAESPSVSALTRISPPRAAAPMRAATCTPWPP